MKRVNILDCTLRDGAYLIDSQFGNTAIKGIIEGLTESGIDVIECGFLKDEPHREGTTIFNNAAQLRSFLPTDKRHSSYVCLADYSRYHIDNLEPYDGTSIDGVRACFFKNERFEVIDFCKAIVNKGYKLYVQPVDILGYTDAELLDLIEKINELEPYAFSIVDTFGSLYREDLQRVFYLVHHNLWANAKIGFHSHNNLQMSFALSQDFIDMSQGLRDIVVDSTMAGMGRGAGNTNTELVMQYMNRKFNSGYDIDIVLDLIDNYIDGFHNSYEWGYSIPYFLAGSHSAHVNNISYLSAKAGIASRDINFLLNRLDPVERKRYDYSLLEKTYLDYQNTHCEDDSAIASLQNALSGKDILVLLPGHTIKTCQGQIQHFYKDLQYFREQKKEQPLGVLLWDIYQRTGFYYDVQLMPDGAKRKENLLMLVKKAEDYEKTVFKGLFYFNRYMEQLKSYEIELGEAGSGTENENVVKIMTIHKSKGLEFPVVFVSGLSKKFNRMDLTKPMLCHPELGIGMECVNITLRFHHPSLMKKAIQEKVWKDTLEE